MKWLVKESKWTQIKDYPSNLPVFSKVDVGWGNGYVVLDKNHPWFNKHYDEIPVKVHGGLTYSQVIDKGHLEIFTDLDVDDLGKYLIGFDTAHYGDSVIIWTKEKVELEAMDLLRQCLEVLE